MPPAYTARRLFLIDAFVAGVLCVATLLGALGEDLDASAGVVRDLDALGGLLIVGMTLPLVARRLLPRTVAVVTVACTVAGVIIGYPVSIGPWGAILALGSLAYMTSRRDTLLVGVPACVAIFISSVDTFNPLSVADVVEIFMVILFTVLVGDLLRTRRDQNALLAERNRELEALRDVETRSAIADERMRIARDVHDAVGHSLVAITLQARAGLRRLARRPERVGDALREIESLASRALDETRTAVAAIRDGGDVVGLPRQPTLADLPALVDSVRSSDLDVHLAVDPAAHDLTAHVQSAAYRIVQESLSNAAKHARPARADVKIAHRGDTVTVEIIDDSANTVPASGGGSGLRGMRERALQLGGTLDAGPAPVRGWQVRARIPAERVTA